MDAAEQAQAGLHELALLQAAARATGRPLTLDDSVDDVSIALMKELAAQHQSDNGGKS